MKNLKIKAKILVAFAVVFVFTIALGIASMFSLSTISNTADNYVYISLPATNNLLLARRSIRLFQVDILEAICADSQETYDNAVALMSIHREEMFNYLDELLVLDPQFEEEVNQISSIMAEAAIVRSGILSESADRTAAGNAAAFKIYENEYLPLLNDATTVLENLTGELDLAIQARHRNASMTELAMNIIVIATIVVALVVIVIISLVLTKSISTPVKEIEEAMENICNGRISEATVNYHSNDELGSLAHSARKTITFFNNIIPDVALICNNIGDGNFQISTKHHEYYVGETDQILRSLRHVRNNLSGAIRQVDTAAVQLFSGAEQIADGAQTLAQGSTEQASSIQELSATIAELAEKVNKTAENSQTAQTYTDEASASIKESTDYMAGLVDAMNEINNTSNQISQIIKTIEDISFQTNILALNAAVEAARAGEAGKGFAVVADEVRNLANKSADATHHTTELIENALNAVQIGMTRLNATSESLNVVVEREELMSDKVREITEATIEQSAAIQQINLGIEQISNVVQNNSATSEQSAAAAEELSSQANTLKELVSQFTLYEG